jgi:hypothetical protein
MMTHNDFDFYEDLIRPLMKFLIQMNILSNSADSDEDNDGLGSESDEENTIIKTQMHKHGGRSLGET